MPKHVVVFMTASSQKEARKIADALVKDKLAACVNTLPGLRSTYWWKGKVESAREILLLAKTTAARAPALIKRVRGLHSYDVPEAIALPIAAGSRDYLAWIEGSVGGRTGRT